MRWSPRSRAVLMSVMVVVSLAWGARLNVPVVISQPQLDVPYVSTPQELVLAMLQLAEVRPSDVLYDLGCGDGRIVITAARQFGARGIGVDLDPERIREAQEQARQAGVTRRVRFLRQDLFATKLRAATVVTLYLLPRVNLQLRPILLRDLRPGTRVVSHDFDMDDWMPDRTVTVQGTPLYLWIVPAPVAGTWTWTPPDATEAVTLRLAQHFQQVTGTLQMHGRDTPVTDVVLNGDHVRFTALHREPRLLLRLHFDGRVQGNTIVGHVTLGATDGTRQFWRAQRLATE